MLAEGVAGLSREMCYVVGQNWASYPDVNNIDPSKRYTHDTIRPISFYSAEKTVDLGFVGSCMVHKGDIKIVSEFGMPDDRFGRDVSLSNEWIAVGANRDDNENGSNAGSIYVYRYNNLEI